MPRFTHGYQIRSDKSYLETRAELGSEFERWGVKEWNVKREPNGGVTIDWFPRESHDLRTLSSYDQDGPENNIRKLFLIIQALRLNELRGFETQMREFYLRLPAQATYRDPYEVLGARPDADIEDIEALYRSKAKRLHPDQGGSVEAMKELNEAMDRIKADRNGK